KSRRDIATFETAPSMQVSEGASAQICASMGGQGGVTVPQDLPFCATQTNQAALPHWSPALWAFNVPSSPMLHMKWTSADGQVKVAVPPSDRNIARYERLTVKMAADESVTSSTDVTITVVDGRGRTWSAPVSTLNPDAVTRLPGTTHPWLRKVILQQVNIPVSSLSKGGLKANDIREVRFTGGSESGGVYLSDLTAENPDVGGRKPGRLPTVDLVPANVDEGSAPGTAQVAAVISQRVG
ncbi:hypothetical protein ACFQ07_14925, partial [Actinomadura adrarensis]